MRNYDTKSKKSEKTDNFFLCPVIKCNRKYKREDKLKKHVEKDHYFETRNRNYFSFDDSLRSEIFNLAEGYIQTLYEISNVTVENLEIHPEIRTTCKNLLPQILGKETKEEENELLRMLKAQQTLASKLFKFIKTCDWEKVMNDLECFFRLGLPYYDTNFCPSLPIDFLWHSLMQNPILYKEVCEKSCKVIMPHCNQPRTKEEDNKRYEYFLEVFQNTFRRTPYFPEISSETTKFEYLIEETKNIFSSLKNKHKDLVLQKIKEKEEWERAMEEKRLKVEEEYAKNMEYLGKFCKENDISYNITWAEYTRYYLPYYDEGYKGDELKIRAKMFQQSDERNVMSSSC